MGVWESGGGVLPRIVEVPLVNTECLQGFVVLVGWFRLRLTSSSSSSLRKVRASSALRSLVRRFLRSAEQATAFWPQSKALCSRLSETFWSKREGSTTRGTSPSTISAVGFAFVSYARQSKRAFSALAYRKRSQSTHTARHTERGCDSSQYRGNGLDNEFPSVTVFHFLRFLGYKVFRL